MEEYFKENSIANSRLNHYRPSSYFLTEQAALLGALDNDTLDRAAEMFKRVNACVTT